MEARTHERRYSLLLKSFVLVGLLWTVLIASLLIWSIKSENKNTTARTLSQARAFFKQVVLTRDWNAALGGVYVPIDENTQPNPYLDVPRRDIITTEGQTLTLIDQAYMTRQIAELADSLGHVQFRITSLKPIRPDNAPAAWEAEILKTFADKSDEYYGWWRSAGQAETAFRYMAPLWTEKTCLSCHVEQAYRDGDLRGGISITIPANDILTERDQHNREVIISHISIWAVGMLGIFLSFRVSRSEYLERSRLIEAALKDVRTLKGLIPICAKCKKVRNDEGYWDQIETYVRNRSDAEFSHGICPECKAELYGRFSGDLNENPD